VIFANLRGTVRTKSILTMAKIAGTKNGRRSATRRFTPSCARGRWGIETSIIVPGAFTGGTNHFAHAGSPADEARVAEYEAGPYKDFADQVLKGFASIVPPDADVSAVADAIVRVVDAPFGKRPFRVHIDPTQDGAEVVNVVSDRVRAELLRRIGLGDLLAPRDLTAELQTAA